MNELRARLAAARALALLLVAATPAFGAETPRTLGIPTGLGKSVSAAGDIDRNGLSDYISGNPNAERSGVTVGGVEVHRHTPGGEIVTTLYPDGPGSLYGSAVSAAGDVNADGFADIVVGAPGHSGGHSNEGRAYLYKGSPTGIVTVPSWIYEPNLGSSAAGSSVGFAGDVNGDGYDDVIVGEPGFTDLELSQGRARVFPGGPSGLSLAPIWTAEGTAAAEFFGFSVAGAGDVNGDGFADVVVGSIQYSNGQNFEGAAFLYLGGPGGPSLTADYTFESDTPQAYAGTSVATAGDTNADGYSDFLIGAYGYANGQSNEGTAWLVLGGPISFFLEAYQLPEENTQGALMGYAVAPCGDLNGDGLADFLVGAPNYNDGMEFPGAAIFYLGKTHVADPWISGYLGGPNQSGAFFGGSLCTIGDMDNDGYSDVVIGAPSYFDGVEFAGTLVVVHGGATPIFTRTRTVTAGTATGEGLGSILGSAGDVNGDGVDDVIIGSPYFANGESFAAGAAYVFHGGFDPFQPEPPGATALPDWTFLGTSLNDAVGFSVAAAGDVNGDGYGDVLVGAPQSPFGGGGRGIAYLFYGSATGLSPSPGWTEHGEGITDELGTSVAGAGDVNGDGFADVLVGAPASHIEGAVFLYLGSALGLAHTPHKVFRSGVPGTPLGYSVAGVGDFNRDGFADFALGAPDYSNGQAQEGAIFVYRGSPLPISTTPNAVREGGMADAYFGDPVRAAGDVNGDGFSDILVAAGLTDVPGPLENAGRVVVYAGSASGISANPIWDQLGTEAFGQFGYRAVSSAGDINNDGFGDIIVGEPGYQSANGRALVYLGRSNGLDTTPILEIPPTDTQTSTGTGVAGGGDWNGDGFSDLLVGAPRDEFSELEQGVAIAVFPNVIGSSPVRAIRQFRADNSAPIGPGLASESQSAFRLVTHGRSLAGRARVRLEREIKPLATAFNGAGLASSPKLLTGTPVDGDGSTVDLNLLVGGLAINTPYRWRARVASDSPYFPHSIWFSVNENGKTEIDLRTGGAQPPVDVGPDGGVAVGAGLSLSPGRPNPFRGATTLTFTLPRSGLAEVGVYDVAGRRVRTLLEGAIEAGTHALSWDGLDAGGRRAPAGTYFVRLRFEDTERVSRIVSLP
ncbi:MAG: FG-GAP-like repeat-containing protein [Candidatus Eiseniibacteriota bacterium]